MTSQTIALIGDSITQAASTNSSDNTNIISALTKANPGVVTKISHGYTTGDTVFHWGVQGMTQVDEITHTVTNTAANTYSLGVDTTAFSNYTSGGRSFRTKNAVILHTAQGWMSGVNMLSGQRYAFQHKNNRGISGNTTTEMAARVATDIPASLGATIVVIMGGTNDIGTTNTTPSKTPAQIAANLQTCINYVTNTLGKVAVIGTVPPNSNNNTVQLDDRDTLNGLIRAMAGPNVIVWDYWSAVADGVTRGWKTNYSYDGTHPAPLGGFIMAQSLEAALAARYGRSTFALQPANLLINPTFTGTGGTISASTTGVIADSWITEAATVSGTKTFSKSASGQVIAFNYGSGLTTGERISMRQSVTSGLVVGTSYVLEMELTLDSWSGTGTLYEISLNLRNQSSAWGTDNSKRNTDPLAVTEMISASGVRSLILRTPAIEYLTGWTELRARLDIISKCDTGTSVGQVTVKKAQLYAV